jgi:ATP synthase protein I
LDDPWLPAFWTSFLGAGWITSQIDFSIPAYLTLVGILMGMGGGLYLVWLRFGR